MRKAMRLLAELVGVFVCGVIGFFVGLILAAGAVLAWLLGCASALFLLVALAESACIHSVSTAEKSGFWRILADFGGNILCVPPG